MEVVQIEVSKLKPYEKNAKKHPQSQIDNVAKSIKEFGWQQPVVVDEEYNVIIGHCRLLASKQLGLEKVPCYVAKGLTQEQVKKLRLLDNKTNESDWDLDILAEDLGWGTPEELDFSGYEVDWGLPETVEETPEIVEDDFNGEVPETTTTQLGDIFQLGEHRLMCGDSTDVLNINILMDGKKADLVFTDPPYGMKKENDGVANDNLNYDELLEFNKQWIPLTFDALKENGSWYCWGIDEPLMDIYSNILKPMAKQNKITFRNLLTWDKGNGQGQMAEDFRMYAPADEKCLFVMCGVQGFNTNSDNYFEAWEPIRKYLYDSRVAMGWDVPTMKRIVGHSVLSRDHWTSKSQFCMPTEEVYNKMKAEAERQRKEKGTNNDAFKKEHDAFKKEYDEIKKEYYSTRAYFDNTHDNMNNVWHFERTTGQEKETAGGHATPKPIALCSRAIKTSSKPNDIVLDVFGGSGSTLIACEQLGRKAYLMELEPKWCDVIIKRWEDFTGQKAVKL